MHEIPPPPIIKDKGYVGASKFVLDAIFNGIFDQDNPNISIEAFRQYTLIFLKEVTARELDGRPSQYQHLFLGRFLMATAAFAEAVHIVADFSSRNTEEIYLTNTEEISLTFAILFLDLVGVFVQPGKLSGDEISLDSNLPLEYIMKQIRDKLKPRKRIKYASWLKYIECLELNEKRWTRKAIFKHVYGDREIENPSDTVAKALRQSYGILRKIIEGRSFSDF